MEAANFEYEHPQGTLFGFVSGRGLAALVLPSAARTAKPRLLHSADNLGLARVLRRALDNYFAGARVDFADIPVDISAGTPFQQQVWRAAQGIPWGATCSYGELARRMGRSLGVARAVGRALGTNPVPIVVPCHRIVGADGSLVGFSAGLDWKHLLLDIEHPQAEGRHGP